MGITERNERGSITGNHCDFPEFSALVARPIANPCRQPESEWIVTYDDLPVRRHRTTAFQSVAINQPLCDGLEVRRT